MEPWNWAPGLAPMWRSSDDIIYWEKPAGTLNGGAVPLDQMILKPALWKAYINFDMGLHPAGHHTGFHNDLDMMMVGNAVARGSGSIDLTDAESRTHIGMWVIAGSPLLIGNDLTRMNAATRATLTHAEMLAISQDGRGLQGVKVAEDAPGLQVYSKILSGTGKRAVLLLNRTGASAPIEARWAEMGLGGGAARVRDVWAKTDLGSKTASYSATVPANGSLLLLVSGSEAGSVTYEAETAANELPGTAQRADCPSCSGASKVGGVGNGATLSIEGASAAAAGIKLANLVYANGDAKPRRATLLVNGQTPTVVSFPSTGGWDKIGSVSVLLSLAKGSGNTVAFSNAGAWAPDLDAVVIQDIGGATGFTNGGSLAAKASGRCVDLPNNNATMGISAGLWDCHGGQNQTFTRTERKELGVYGNRCLDALGGTPAVGTKIGIWECNGGANQKWELNANGSVAIGSLCMDQNASGGLELATCNAATSTQQWTFKQ